QFNPTVDLVVDDLRGDQGQQGEFAPVNIPATENGALGKGPGVMHLPIAAGIIAVYIGKDAGINHGMIHRRVEGGLLRLGAPGHGDAAQLSSPSQPGLLMDGPEIPAWNL